MAFASPPKKTQKKVANSSFVQHVARARSVRDRTDNNPLCTIKEKSARYNQSFVLLNVLVKKFEVCFLDIDIYKVNVTHIHNLEAFFNQCHKVIF